MLLSVAVLEDDECQLRELASALARFPLMKEADIRQFSSAMKLREAVNRGARFDIALMDIELGEENGIRLVQELFPPYSHTQVIYITAYINYCTLVYDTRHISFLVKPVSSRSLEKELLRATAALASIKRDFLTVTSGTSVFHVPYCDIPYIESRGRTMFIHTAENEIETYGKLNQLASGLDRRFNRCHQSFVVNFDYVASMVGQGFMLRSGEAVPISRSHYAETREMFLQYIGQEETYGAD